MSGKDSNEINLKEKDKIVSEKRRNANQALSGQEALKELSSFLKIKAEKIKLLDKVQLDGENEIIKR